MKRLSVFCFLLALWLSFEGSSVWAIDVGWMRKGVRVWYLGAAGTGFSSDAEEAYLFSAVNGSNVQVTKHSAINHWGSPNPVDTSTYSFLDKGPCWMHPQVLQNLQIGDNWMGFEITLVTRSTYTYNQLPYHFLPAKALFDLKPQREVVKLVYMIAYYSTGTAYFDAETGLCLQYSQSNGYTTVFFVLSEINYDFARQEAFAEDDGPHTGFKSEVIESSLSGGAQYIMIQSSVETRYGDTVEMWVSTSYGGTIGSALPPNENYCFFGSVPVLRHMDMSVAPNYPPEQWNAYGQYLWWWVPTGALQSSTINVFGVPMTRTSTNPYIFEATTTPSGLHFSKLYFGTDGYVTALSARDSATGLNIGPGQAGFTNLTTVKGLDYYKGTMGRATPAVAPSNPQTMLVSGSFLYGDFGPSGAWLWDGSTWNQLTSSDPENMVISGSLLYADFGISGGLWLWNGGWSKLTSSDPTKMVVSGSLLYAEFYPYGTWLWNGFNWSKLTSSHPENMVAAGSYLYADFGSDGTWLWNGGWSKLTSSDPTKMVASGSYLYAAFGSDGAWLWNGNNWNKLK